jgi:hypothetical protein
VLSIALVPGESDRVALSKPSAAALTIQLGAAAAAPPPPAVAPPPVAAAPVVEGPPVTATAPIAPVAPAPAQVPPAVAPAVPNPVAAPVRQAAVPASQRSRGTTTGVRLVLLAEALLTLISFGLLGVGPARGLVRLTGVETRAAERARGIGRFSRERVGSAPSL